MKENYAEILNYQYEYLNIAGLIQILCFMRIYLQVYKGEINDK